MVKSTFLGEVEIAVRLGISPRFGDWAQHKQLTLELVVFFLTEFVLPFNEVYT